MASWDEARRCPKCGHAGEETVKSPGPDGSKIITLRCDTTVCLWYNTTWVVQVLSDGTIPERHPGGEKTFPKIPGMTQEKAIKELRRVRDKEG